MKGFLIFCLTICSVLVFGQDINVNANNNNIESNNLFEEMVTEITVHNTSNVSKNIKVSREVINETEGSSNYFCWDLCYLPIVNISTNPINFSGGEINESSFSVHYSPNGNEGETRIRYCAFDEQNVADSACVVVRYYASSTVNINDFNSYYFSEFYPNPSSLITEFSYNILTNQQCEVVVLDMLGNIVKKHQLSREDGKLRLSVTDLKAGLYFANIMADGQLHEIKRLIVSD
ncbi:MAG: hypothetical protein CMP75_02950 [Flavobacteriales bacterium]|nr:hypothetical protein [Flavobacteriales bacterium]